jgi:predicted ATPase/class 3 adenylate cyclase
MSRAHAGGPRGPSKRPADSVMPAGPSGRVTFLFTDIEGSTRRWEADPEAMRAALARHDRLLRSTVEDHGGWLFKHTGDGICAAFGSAQAAIETAIDAQRQLELPVRMGLVTGDAHEEDGDYFGPVLNAVARVMAAGHGGQVLVAGSTADLVTGVDLVDLGDHRLRDLSSAVRLFQVRASGLRDDFPPVRTVTGVPGNLPVPATTFIGREDAVRELVALLPTARLTTLTGVGGVGKTRLALQVGAELVTAFPDGVWLVELAPVGEPEVVPNAVAAVLGVSAQAGPGGADVIAESLSGRRMLLILDNCEHVLDAVADLVETILTRSSMVKVLATSREGLRVASEQLWAVPPMDLTAGTKSAAVELFLTRARAVAPGFGADGNGSATTVLEICQRLDGLALPIELAAARVVAMSAEDIRDRLDERFRLLSGSRRGAKRHQTLHNVIAWSYDLLHDDEAELLDRCAVFADGFDAAAAVALSAETAPDEYTVLDLLESLVRKSLITTTMSGGHVRFGMLETIRQFGTARLQANGRHDDVRDRHARYYAEQAVVQRSIWDGPSQATALEWVEAEFANLRTGFRWATNQGDLVTAASIAVLTAMLAFPLQRYEPAEWAEEILPAAVVADLRQLPRLYSAAGLCALTGRPQDGIEYAETAVALEAEGRYEPSESGWSGLWAATAYAYAGQRERFVEVCAALVPEPGLAHVTGLCGVTMMLPALGRADEAMAIAEEAVDAARAAGNPYWIACALYAYGRAFAMSEPHRALTALREGLAFSRQHRVLYFESRISRDAARLEAVYGQFDEALTLFDTAIDSFHRAGDQATLATSLVYLAVLLDRMERPEVAAVIYGASTHHVSASATHEHAVGDLRTRLGESRFDEHAAMGAAMEPAEAVGYARHQIQLARRRSLDTS